MTYRVYLRWPDQRVSDKTVTEDRALAELAYRSLVNRQDLLGKPVGVAFTETTGGKPQQIAYHSFDGTSAEGLTPPAKPARPTITIRKRPGSA